MSIIKLILPLGIGLTVSGYSAMAHGNYPQQVSDLSRLVEQLKSEGADDKKIAVALSDEAEGYRQVGAFDKAEALFKQALMLVRNAPSSQRERVAILNNLGALYRETGSYERSLACYREAQTYIGKTISPNDALNGTLLNGLGSIALIKGDLTSARKQLERSFRIREAALGSEHLEVAETMNNLAVLEAKQHHYALAESMLNRVLSITEGQLGPQHPDMAGILRNLGLLYKTLRRNTDAETCLRRALEIDLHALPPSHPDVARIAVRLAEVLMDEHKSAEAELLFKQALDLSNERPHRIETEDAQMLEEYGNALRFNGKSADADIAEARAQSIRSELKYLFKP